MKVIDLFNKITNGEELPNKIRIRNDTLIYNKDHLLNLQDYYYMDDEENATWKIWRYDLNDEVEIIEEDKNIENLNTWFSLEKDCENDNIQYANHNFRTYYDKINEIIDKLNEMEDK